MMEGWESHKIKDLDIKLIDGDRGKQYPKKKEFLDEGYCLFLNTSNVRQDGFDFNTTSFITKEKDELLRKGKLSRHDIILTTRGTIGNIAIYNDNVPFDNIRINSGMLIIRANKHQFNNNYLFQYFKSSLFQEQVKLFQYGAAQPQLPIGTLNYIKVVVPPLKTQRKIASILSGYDDLIENNLKRIKLLEEQAQQTYEEWFVRFKFPGYEDVEIDEESCLPVGWEKKNLGDILEISSSKRIFLSDYVSEGIPFYRGKEIILKSKNEALNDRLFISEEKFKEIKSKYDVPKEGDILVTAVGTLGYPYLITKSDGDFYFKDGNLIWLKGNEKISSSYLISSFKNEHFQTMLNNIAIGSSQKALTIKSLKAIKHIIPSLPIQEKYDEIVISIYNGIENLQNQNQHLKEARDILLPRLMSGIIDVDGLEVNAGLGMVAEDSEIYKTKK